MLSSNMRLVRLMFLMGLKIPPKFQLLGKWESKNILSIQENEIQNIYGRSQWSNGVKRMIFHNFCIIPRGWDRQETVASWCISVSADKQSCLRDNQFPSSKEYYNRNFLLQSGILKPNWLLLTFNPEFPAPGPRVSNWLVTEGPGDTGGHYQWSRRHKQRRGGLIREERTRDDIGMTGCQERWLAAAQPTLTRALNPRPDSSDISAPDVAADTRFCTKHQ